MSDKIVNFYDKLGIKGAVLSKTFKRHYMFNKSHTLCVGGTGSGKSNALIIIFLGLVVNFILLYVHFQPQTKFSVT